MKVIAVRHLYPEKKGFKINRPTGENNMVIFVHFRTRVKMTLEDGTVDVEPGTCIFYSRSFYQQWTALTPLIHDWIHIDGDVESNMSRFGLEFDKLYILNQPDEVTNIVNNIETEFFKALPYSKEMCNIKLKELMVCISRNPQVNLKNALKLKNELENVRNTMFSNLERDWRVEDMARIISLSPSRFHTIYKEAFGVSPTNDLINARMHMAKVLLSDAECSVGDIAAKLGYSNVYHFIRQFTKTYGISPGKFSRNN